LLTENPQKPVLGDHCHERGPAEPNIASQYQLSINLVEAQVVRRVDNPVEIQKYHC
jgi:hypothetical protein